MSDPLDELAISHADAMKHRLAEYIKSMPRDLRILFEEKFQRIDRAELAQLRSDLQAAQERIAELTQDDRYCPLCTWRGPVELVNGVCPQCDVDWPKACREHRDALTVAQERIAEMAQQINAARNAIRYLRPWRAKDIAADYASLVGGECGYTQSLSDYAKAADAWLAANPAPETEPQP